MPAPAATLALRASLLTRAYSCTTADQQRGLLLSVRDVTGVFAEDLRLTWLGANAITFLDTHKADLVPGRCVDLQVNAICPAGHELRGQIQACELAPLPPSWLKHQANQSPATTNPANTNPEQQAA